MTISDRINLYRQSFKRRFFGYQSNVKEEKQATGRWVRVGYYVNTLVKIDGSLVDSFQGLLNKNDMKWLQ